MRYDTGIIVNTVHIDVIADLLQIVFTGGVLCFRDRFIQSRKNESSQYSDYRNHRQEFYKGKLSDTSCIFFISVLLDVVVHIFQQAERIRFPDSSFKRESCHIAFESFVLI